MYSVKITVGHLFLLFQFSFEVMAKAEEKQQVPRLHFKKDTYVT